MNYFLEIESGYIEFNKIVNDINDINTKYLTKI